MPNQRPTLLTTTAACHRHDIFDRAWAILEPILPGGPGKAGRPAQNNFGNHIPSFDAADCNGNAALTPPEF